jgi:anti-anti-sigma regulatory factor
MQKGGSMEYQVAEQGTLRNVKLGNGFNRSDCGTFKGFFKNIEKLSRLTIDLSNLEFAGTDFINALIAMRRAYLNDIYKLVLLNPNESLLELFTITNTSAAFNLETSFAGSSQAVLAA